MALITDLFVQLAEKKVTLNFSLVAVFIARCVYVACEHVCVHMCVCVCICAHVCVCVCVCTCDMCGWDVVLTLWDVFTFY